MGKKTIDFKTQRVASRGRKSKAGGGKKIKSDSIIYTPVKNYHLGCLGYPKQYQTKSFESKILEKATFYAKNKHFLPYLAISLFIQLPKF